MNKLRIPGTYGRKIFRPKSIIVTGRRVSIIVALGFLVFTGITLYLHYKEHIRRTEKYLNSMNLVIREHIALSIRNVEGIITAVSDRLHHLDPNETEFSDFLLMLRHEIPFLRGLVIVDKTGMIVTDSRGTKGLDLKDRTYFRAHTPTGKESIPKEFFISHESGILFIGNPHKSRRNDEWFIPLSAAVRDKEGNLMYVVMASLNPLYFESLFDSIELSAYDHCLLQKTDGTIWMHYPSRKSMIGKKIPDDPLIKTGSGHPEQGFFLYRCPLDNVTRYTAVTTLLPYPLMVRLSIEQTEILKPFYFASSIWVIIIALGIAGLFFVDHMQTRKTAIILDQSRKLDKNAEEIRQINVALSASEDRFRTLFEHANDAILWIDAKTQTIINCNYMAEVFFETRKQDFLGTSREKVLDKLGLEDIPETDVPEPGCPQNETQATGSIHQVPEEQKGRNPEGSNLRFEHKTVLSTGSGKKHVHVSVSRTLVQGNLIHQLIIRDIGRIKEAEMALRKSHDELEERVAERTRDLTRMNHELSLEIQVRRRVEFALRQSEDRFRSILEMTPVALCLTNKDGNFEYVNPAYCKLYGYSFQELVGKHFSIVLPKDHQTEGKGIHDRFFAWDEYGPSGIKEISGISMDAASRDQGHAQSFHLPEEWQVVRKDGKELTVLVNAVAITGEDGQPKKATFVLDISDRKQFERSLKHYSEKLEEMVDQRTKELRQTRDRLIRKEKLAVLGQLAGGVGHELRNPLGVMANAVYFLKMTQDKENRYLTEYLDIIEKEVVNAEKIVTDLLDYSRVKTMDKEKVCLKKIVETVLEKNPPKDEVKIMWQFPDELPRVFADPYKTEQIITNIVINACQAMASPEETEDFSPLLIISGEAKEGMVMVSFTDNGPGIEAENMGFVFEPLYTTKAKGIGLGLAVSKSLAEAMSGSITASGTPGKGTTFTLTLPTPGYFEKTKKEKSED